MRLASKPTKEITLSVRKIRDNTVNFSLRPYATEIIDLSTNISLQDLREVLPGFPDKMVKLQKLGMHRPKGSCQLAPDYSLGKFPSTLESLKLTWMGPLCLFANKIDTLKEFTFTGDTPELNHILKFMHKVSSERVILHLTDKGPGTEYESVLPLDVPVLNDFKSSLVVHCNHKEVIENLISRIRFSNGANLEIKPSSQLSIGLEYILSNVGDIATLPTEAVLDYSTERIKLSGPNGSLTLYSVFPKEVSSALEGKYPLSFEKTQQFSLKLPYSTYESFPWPSFNLFGRLPDLETLTIEGNISAVLPELLSSLGSRSLRKLELKDCFLSRADVELIGELASGIDTYEPQGTVTVQWTKRAQKHSVETGLAKYNSVMVLISRSQ